jgi:cytochrome c biogenesis protein CcdA
VLTLVALQRKVLWGGTLLFAYGLGHELLLFLAGASSGWASKIAGSHVSQALGRWLPRVMGTLLVGSAAWVLWVAWKARMAG